VKEVSTVVHVDADADSGDDPSPRDEHPRSVLWSSIFTTYGVSIVETAIDGEP
jgi:hypothetical protein